MKIICPGGYTWNNKGDAALVLSMLAELRRVAPKSDLVVLSDSPSLDSRMYDETVLPPLYGRTLEDISPGVETSKLMSLWHSVRYEYRRRIGWRINRWLDGAASRKSQFSRRGILLKYKERLRFHISMAWLFIAIHLAGRYSHLLVQGETGRVLKEFCEADFAVFVPGGYFIAPHLAHTYWFRHVAAVLAARWLGLPIHFYACTIGPFHGSYNRWLAQLALNHSHLIYVREQSSYEAVGRIAPRARCQLAADAGFLLPSCSSERVAILRTELLISDQRQKIGISVRDYQFPGHPNPDEQRNTYLDAIARTVEHIVGLGMSVYFVPQVLADEVNDLSVSREVMSLIQTSGHVYLIERDLDPRELKGLYSCFDSFIGVRMHANIFALSSGVPTVAIAYEPKTEGIMQQLGLSDFSVNIRRLDAPTLIDLFNHLSEKADVIRACLAIEIPNIQRIAMQTADDLSKSLIS